MSERRDGADPAGYLVAEAIGAGIQQAFVRAPAAMHCPPPPPPPVRRGTHLQADGPRGVRAPARAEVNANGGIGGRSFELIPHPYTGDPARAAVARPSSPPFGSTVLPGGGGFGLLAIGRSQWDGPGIDLWFCTLL